MARKHKHKFLVTHWSGVNVGYSCRCGEKGERRMTKEEYEKIRILPFSRTRRDDVHHVWHKLDRKLDMINQWTETNRQDKKLTLGGICEKFAKKYPEEVVVLRCDDSCHAGSDLVLVTHEAKQKWMGVTALMFPQCDGRQPAVFFLYPSHVEPLLKALTKIHKRSIRKSKQEDRQQEIERKWWNKQINKEVENGVSI